jgi:uncharacterized protein YbgA (DUF1722 family)
LDISKINPNESLTHQQISGFVRKSFAEIKNNTDINAIMHFHSINKFLLMVHGSSHVRILGNLIANHENLPLSTILERYEKYLETVLKNEPTIKSHTNVLQKIFGYFKKDLTKEEKSKILKMISDYGTGKETLNDVLLLLEDLTEKFQKTYLVRQTYFLLYAKIPSSTQTKNI